MNTFAVDEQALNLHLDDDPADWVVRRVLADLLEEQGRDEEAMLQRWLVENKKHPDHVKDHMDWKDG